MSKQTTQAATRALIYSQRTVTRRLATATCPSLVLYAKLQTYTRPHAASTTSTREATSPRLFSITKKMASDEDYMAFLDKANRDADEAHAAAAAATTRTQTTSFKALDAGETPAPAIAAVCKDTFYVSDADEPFEAVSLRYSGKDGLPDEVEFAKLIQHWDADNANVSIMDPTDWDVRGAYTNVVEAVREASRGNDVRVYRVTRDATRTEYWVVSATEDRIVGVKALAVES
ncbi:hypothetical protein VHEMI01691 [[Torrubiella] hemipterigena]|uniref:Uncharacterized protein n=1 Tax=[Torrubiella] hemipterigena TaxID=1531966 RepID=A0A0A1T626_9HYPO|nr:hypothetical protein VHEMI01691 [[Torrubiella] hemipterigena]